MTDDKDRAAFEAAYTEMSLFASVLGYFDRTDDGDYKNEYVRVGWVMWVAGTAAERERAAKVCLSVMTVDGDVEWAALECEKKIRSAE